MADYGLNAVADAMGKDYFGAGENQAAGLQATLASTAATRANTARTEGLTPLEIERARLGNLQSQADEQAGVYGAKSEQGLWEAKQKARQAQQAWEQLPEEHKTKMIEQTRQKTSAVIKGAVAQVMQTGDTMSAVQFIEQNLPEVTKDKGWASAIQQYKSMSPEQAIAKMNETLARMGSSEAYADPKQQGQMGMENLRHQNAMELEGLRGQQRQQELQSRPAAGSSSSTNPTEALLALTDAYYAERDPQRKAHLLWQINVIKGAQEKQRQGLVGTDTTTTETAPPPDKQMENMPPSKLYNSWPNEKRIEFLRDMAKHPELVDEASKRFGIHPDWIRQQIKTGKWNK